MKKDIKIEFWPPFSAKEAINLGISRQSIAYYKKTGKIERVSRGIYQGCKYQFSGDFKLEEMIIEASKIEGAIICLISALAYYQMTDEFMRELWLAIPNERGNLKREGVHFVRFRNTTLGVCAVTEGGITFNIFDKERTIIDCFRYLDFELSIKALKIYMQSTKEHRPDFDKLYEYSRILRTPITDYVQALLVE